MREPQARLLMCANDHRAEKQRRRRNGKGLGASPAGGDFASVGFLNGRDQSCAHTCVCMQMLDVSVSAGASSDQFRKNVSPARTVVSDPPTSAVPVLNGSRNFSSSMK